MAAINDTVPRADQTARRLGRGHRRYRPRLTWTDRCAPAEGPSASVRDPRSIVVTDRGNARSMGAALSGLHEELARASIANVDVVKNAMQLIGQGPECAHATMALDLAAQADAMGHRSPYHNAGHLREVTVNMINLCALNAARGEGVVLDKTDLTIAIASAVGHDLGHDGGTNNVPMVDEAGNALTTPDGNAATVNVPFLLEDKAIVAINIAGRRAGVPEADLKRMQAAVLTTDENAGYAILDAVLDPAPGPVTSGLLALRPELAELDDPKCLRLATMLRDADLLGSCGTSAAENDRETARLERERGLRVGALRGGGTEYFMGTIARGMFLSPEGRMFQDNLVYLRELNATRLRIADPTAMTLAEVEKIPGGPRLRGS